MAETTEGSADRNRPPGDALNWRSWTCSCIAIWYPLQGVSLGVLFVTTEMDDFIRVGGLAAVSAALPRALRPWADVRVLLPGYRDIVERLTHIEIVGECASKAQMPACRLGRASTRDGLPVYVLLCPQLYDRPG